MPLEIRLVEDSEYKAVNDFFNSARNINRPTPETVRTYEQFYWEFMDGPSGRAIYAAAWDLEEGKEPEIVGIQCVIPLKMISVDGQCFLTAKGEDSLIDINAIIKYKKTDILRELYNLIFAACRDRGIELVWGFNNMYATNKRLGFSNPVKSFYSVLVLKPGQAYKNSILQKSAGTTFEKGKITFLSGMSFLFSLKRFLVFSQKRNYRFNVGMNENADLFLRAATPGNFCFLLQDSQYLKWRISENPYPVQYRSFQLLDHENILQAQVICSINKNVAFIEQILFDRTLKMRTVYWLLKKTIKSLKKENICMIRFIGFKDNPLNKKEMDMLENIGFVQTKKGEQVCFVNLSEDFMFNPKNVYLSRLYKQGIN